MGSGVRSPFVFVECGMWYGYGLLPAMRLAALAPSQRT
jgi:hypothetical protein